jgi:hypothetical protein
MFDEDLQNNGGLDFLDLFGQCQIGTQFKEGHAGIISKVSFFIYKFTNKANVVNNLIFQGSNDNEIWD